MSDPSGFVQRLWRRFVARVGNPLEWCDADKMAFLSSWLVLHSVFSVLSLYHAPVVHVRIAPEDQALIAELRYWSWLALGGWSLFFLVAITLRRRVPNHGAWRHLMSQAWALTFAPICYAMGTTTTAMIGFVTMVGALGGILLIGWFATLLGMFTFTVISLGTEIAAYHGVIPYAPAFKVFAVEDGKLLLSWLLVIWISIFITVAATMSLFGYIFYRWRDREEQLAEAQVLLTASNEQLKEATGLIRRYVPAQLAEQILSGDYAKTEKFERRKITVFFSDIKGFTDASDELEAEDLSRVLNEYLSEMSAIADRYGATLDKFVGDAVMIFFGAPTATSDKDHALRAVRMAMEMQERMGALRRKWSDEGIENPFEIRIGINTGVATVGNFGSDGRMDYTAVGKQVNLAARLESNCAPGKILLSHAAWALVKEEIPCAFKGEIQVKGIHHPVKTYEVS